MATASAWRRVPAPGRRPPGALVLVAVLLALTGGAWLFSPWYATWRLMQDARAADAAALSRRVDWPALRASLKPQLQARADAALAATRARPAAAPPADWWTRLGQAFSRPVAQAVAQAQVEVAVTPELVAQTLRTGRAPPVGLPGAQPKPQPFTPGDTRPLRRHYTGTLFDPDLDQFTAIVASRSRPADAVTIRLVRRGWFRWSLATIELPQTR